MTIQTMYKLPATLTPTQQAQITEYISTAMDAGQIVGSAGEASPDATYHVLAWNQLSDAQNFQTFLNQFAPVVNAAQQFPVSSIAVWNREQTQEEIDLLNALLLQKMGTPVGNPDNCVTFGNATYSDSGITRFWLSNAATDDYVALINSFDPPPVSVTIS